MEDSRPQTSLAPHERTEMASDGAAFQTLASRIMYSKASVVKNAEQQLQTTPTAVAFRTTTIAPSPPTTGPPSAASSTTLSALTTSSLPPSNDAPRLSPYSLSAGLHLKTDVAQWHNVTSDAESVVSSRRPSAELNERQPSLVNAPSRSSSFKKALGRSTGTNPSAPNSAFSSPMLSGMPDVTPLPSPLLSGDSPGPWRKLLSRPTSREYPLPSMADSTLVTKSGESWSSAMVSVSKRRAYHGLVTGAGDAINPKDALAHRDRNGEGHARNRSISEYTPENMQIPKARHQTVSGSHTGMADSTLLSTSPTEHIMRRERNMAVERGMTPAHRVQNILLPTPPASRTGAESSDSDSSVSNMANSLPRMKKSKYEHFDAHTRDDEKRRRWRALKVLGTGTFSRVFLATSEAPAEQDRIDEDGVFGRRMDGITLEPKIDPKKVVAIKICEYGPKGGASEERVEVSVKRELEIMRSIHHPSLVHLRAWNIEETRAILVLSYCPGGDLFEVASEHAVLLVPSLLRRMFAELIGAVQYLHDRHIVHRDIKLENVLVNLPQDKLAKDIDWVTYPYSVITLTDLGLSRRFTDDEKLSTRCGSDDYAAPEVIMGQPYDGCAVDAWSLGVLLYALLESRLPFDPTPGMTEGHKQRSRTSHRIARVEWRWVKYAGEHGDHEGDVAQFELAGLHGAMEVTEGLLKRARSRWPLSKVADQAWVQDAIGVEGGIKFREEDNPEEVDLSS